MTAPVIFGCVVLAGVLIAIGWSLHGAVAEARHDCLPHDPKRCREKQ